MSKITDLIDGYADMSAEERLAALEALDQPQADDTETRKWKTQYDKTAHDLAEMKKQNKSLQERIDASLSDEEKAKKARDEELESIIAERDRLVREARVSKRTASLIALGYSQDAAEGSANAMADISDDDFNTVIGNAGTHREGLEKTIRAGIVASNPKPDGKGSGTKTITKAEIMAIKDPAKRHQMIAENMDLFTK